MKNMKPPNINSIEVYEEIIKRKKKETYIFNLKKLKKYVLLRYKEYEDNKENLEKINSSKITDINEKESLLSCYNRSEKGYLEVNVIEEILKIQSPQYKNKCPYCLIDSPRTIDHYVPKEHYPEFAVFAPNLIPCCSSCNSEKGDLWIEDGQRVFINYYFDDLPKKKFLKAILYYDKDNIEYTTSVKFKITNEHQIDPKLYKIIKKHFRKLKLEKKYTDKVEEEISNIYCNVKENLNEDLTFFIKNLKINIRTCTEKYGVNYWKVALYEAIIESNFIEAIYYENTYKVNN